MVGIDSVMDFGVRGTRTQVSTYAGVSAVPLPPVVRTENIFRLLGTSLSCENHCVLVDGDQIFMD